MNQINHPLMAENIDEQDIQCIQEFLSQRPIPKLTNGPKVLEFEKEWSKWLGMKYSLFVNSGSSANELTVLAIKYLFGVGEIIVPPLTWVSDISAVIHANMKPVFCDINLKNLSFNENKLITLITPNTKAIFLTHVLGINGLSQRILDICKENNILLIEDVCESHGTTFKNKKCGSFGFASNFSFYFAHHMSTIEGGMVCTNNRKFYEVLRCLRSHGMLRESTHEVFKKQILKENPTLNQDFVFIAPSHNFRSTEINAVLGLSQLKKLDSNNKLRQENFKYFYDGLRPDLYHKELNLQGQCNYAFIVILRNGSFKLRDKIEKTLNKNGIEFRRGLSGGGSQLKQPYLKSIVKINEEDFPRMEFIHHFSWYIGNYPSLTKEKIDNLLNILNNIK